MGFVCLGIKEIFVLLVILLMSGVLARCVLVFASVYLQPMGAGPKHWGVIFWLANQNCLNH